MLRRVKTKAMGIAIESVCSLHSETRDTKEATGRTKPVSIPEHVRYKPRSKAERCPRFVSLTRRDNQWIHRYPVSDKRTYSMNCERAKHCNARTVSRRERSNEKLTALGWAQMLYRAQLSLSVVVQLPMFPPSNVTQLDRASVRVSERRHGESTRCAMSAMATAAAPLGMYLRYLVPLLTGCCQGSDPARTH